VGVWAGGRRPDGPAAPGPHDYDVEGTAHEDPGDHRRLP
ncbi:MAG: hypothetical protein JWM73_1744, partial [Solirubrobacterales bacterium]|nr:hypothetical protein [Solirubrobacterales bacterium]